MFRTVGLDDHPVLPGIYHRFGAAAPGKAVEEGAGVGGRSDGA